MGFQVWCVFRIAGFKSVSLVGLLACRYETVRMEKSKSVLLEDLPGGELDKMLGYAIENAFLGTHHTAGVANIQILSIT